MILCDELGYPVKVHDESDELETATQAVATAALMSSHAELHRRLADLTRLCEQQAWTIRSLSDAIATFRGATSGRA